MKAILKSVLILSLIVPTIEMAYSSESNDLAKHVEYYSNLNAVATKYEIALDKMNKGLEKEKTKDHINNVSLKVLAGSAISLVIGGVGVVAGNKPGFGGFNLISIGGAILAIGGGIGSVVSGILSIATINDLNEVQENIKQQNELLAQTKEKLKIEKQIICSKDSSLEMCK